MELRPKKVIDESALLVLITYCLILENEICGEAPTPSDFPPVHVKSTTKKKRKKSKKTHRHPSAA
jgi:hypothetical protein